MEGNDKQGEDTGVLTRLSKRGEEAVNRLVDELGRNERVTDALGRAMSAKGRVDEATRRTLGQVGLAAADEIKDLRGQLERLEKRLAALEGDAAKGGGSAAKTRGATTASGASKPSTGTAKKTAGTRASSSKGRAGGSAKKPSSSSGST